MAYGEMSLPSPPPLQELMMEYTLSNLQTVFVMDTGGTVISLRPDAYLPADISDRIVNTLARRGKLDNIKLQTLCDVERIQLRKINLSRTSLSDESLEKLSRYKLIELDISECENLSKECLPFLLNLKALQLLNLHKCRDIMEKYGLPLFDFPFKNLRSLNIGYTDLSGVQLHCLIKQLSNLTSLDVSKVVKNGDLSFLEPVKAQLKYLVLHDCMLVESSLDFICKLTNLRHLDISVNNEGFKLPLTTSMLRRMVKCLRELVSIDLSGNDIRGPPGSDNHKPSARRGGGDRNPKDIYLGLHVLDSSDDEDYSSSSSSSSSSDEDDDSDMVERARDGIPRMRDDSDSAPPPVDGRPIDIDESGGEGNLPEKKVEEEEEEEEIDESECVPSSIEGLKGLRHKLNFLGLVGMNECEAEHIPAIKVAGLANEDQILTTIETYLERRGFLLKGLNAYFDILRVINCQWPLRALQGIMDAMKRYPSDNQIQISGSASLFHLTRGNYKTHLTEYWRKAVICCLLDAIEDVSQSFTLLRNCGLTLFNFSIPRDFQFQFERVVRNLVKLALTEDPEGLLQRVYVHMCNSIVCHVEGSQKLQVGKLGIISCMLKLIRGRLERNSYDEVIETAWSTLWNVTDETAYNCEMFLLGDGMGLFVRCKQAFPFRPELLRNMMGLMGNVAEVKELRPQLIPHIPVFAALLADRSDGIEVSYNAAGTLAHIASDGEDAWKTHVSRRDVLDQMIAAIESWRLTEQRNINYRSFAPILRLLDHFHTPEVQLWATWALANLCTVSRVKYCELLREEGGLKKLKALATSPDVWSKVAHYANIPLQLARELDVDVQQERIADH